MQGAEAVYFYLAIISFVLAGGFLITSIILYFRLDIRKVIKNTGGALEQKQIEEIRAKNMGDAEHRGKVNVFEELEKRAKPKRSNTASLRVGTTGSSGSMAASRPAVTAGTTILQQSAKVVNPDFIIEKNIVFVNTNEVI